MSNIIDKIQLSGVTYDIGGQGGSGVSVVEVTQQQYDELPSSAKTDTSKMYVITDAEAGDLTNYYTKTETNTLLGGKADTATTYTKTEVDNALGSKADTATTYTKTEVDNAITAATSTKQDTLVSGTNIKTINNISILGSGNIDVQGGGGGGKAVTAGTNISVTTGETADTINCTIPFENPSNNLLLGYNLTVGGGTYYSLGISPKDYSTSIQTKISGNNTIAIGNNVTITGGTSNRGEYSVAIGKNSNVYGVQSTALGVGCNASGNTTLAIGRYSTSKGNDSVAIGNQANVSGNSSVAIGRLAKVSGDSSVAIGSGATADGAEYKMNLNNQIKVTPSNQVYIYNKDNTEMICLQDQLGGGGGGKAIKGGRGISVTTGETADTVSFNLPISAGTGTNSIKENNATSANGNYSHSEGFWTIANGLESHAEGYSTIASGESTHAEGSSTQANGISSHAEGGSTKANGDYSHTEGNRTIANNQSEHASGQYNVSSSASTTFGDGGNTLFSVGNGTSSSARHNAFEIRQNGDIYCSDGTNDVKLQDTITATASNTTALGGLKLLKLTQAEYDALATKDSNTLYVIVN